MTNQGDRQDIFQAIKDLGDQLNARLDRVESDIRGMKSDIEWMKGADVENATVLHAEAIVAEIAQSESLTRGLKHNRNLTRADLTKMSTDATDLTSDELRRFRRADLVVEAEDRGETCYIVVEASYTVDERDTSRAMRHAQLLERFTGQRAYAAVSGVRKDNRIDPVLASGKVFWYEVAEQEVRPNGEPRPLA